MSPPVYCGNSLIVARSTNEFPLGATKMSTLICTYTSFCHNSLYHSSCGLKISISFSVPNNRGLSLCALNAPSPKVGKDHEKTHILPPMCFMAINQPLIADPRHDSFFASLNNEGIWSRSPITWSIDSWRLTRISSGRGRKRSSKSHTTIICGDDSLGSML